MDETALLNALSIPKEAWFLRNLPFNQLAQRLTLKQRKVCEEAIESYGIRILATINPRNTKISSYEDENEKYEEIHLYAIKLKEWQKQKELYRIFAQIIPYPLVIIFHQGEKMEWVLAKHHRHTNEISLVVDKIYQSNQDIPQHQYKEKFNFNNINKTNLRTLYHSLIEGMVDLELKESYQIESPEVASEKYLARLQEIDVQIAKVQKQAQKETQMNQRLPLHMKIHELKQEKEQLIKELK